MPPVSMKMAKLQKATLDPTKISGRCGRLKCCLRYEFDTYEQIQKQLPRVGSQIVTREGKAKVLIQQIITEQLLIETEDHRRMVIEASEVLTVVKKSTSASQEKPRPETGKPTGQAGSPDSENKGSTTENQGQNKPADGKRRGGRRRGGRKGKKK